VTEFAQRVDAFLAEFFRLSPVHATAAGLHEHDAAWPDLTEVGRQERLAFIDRWETELRGFDKGLTHDQEIDRDLLLMELDAASFQEVELREERWNPLEWVYMLGGGIFPLLARDFAPLADRLASIAGRLEGLPTVIDAAQENLTGFGDRPVGRFQTETALNQLPGIVELVDDSLHEAEEAASGDAAVNAILPRVRASAETAKAALARFETHLRDTVLPQSEGDGRLGRDLFTMKMRHTMRSDTLTPDRILAEAEREFIAVRAEMVGLAREAWPQWCPDRERPDDEAGLVRGVLDAIAADHPAPSEVLDFCERELASIEAFCRERNVIGLAEEPLEIRWTPVFMRSFGGAMLDAPGPLDKGQKTFFSVTPVPDDWSDDQVESYMREDNARMLRLLTIHEAVPGHYLQGVYANRTQSIPRAVFWSGVFAEGWAVYVTQVMMDLGYGADDPALLLTHWKFYLRSVTNAILDARIHVDGIGEDEALRLMVDEGFQEESEARAKYNRARLSSTQLSTYFVGSMEFWDIEREARRRAAEASVDPRGAAAVPEPRIVGGLDPTPGFDYRAHMESVLSHGSPPTSLLRRLVVPGGEQLRA
jgi:uncharacterized protein (DUF885 family)